MIAQAFAALAACVCGWIVVLMLLWHTNPMFQAFVKSKFGRTVIALAAGALAPAVPALIMGDTHTFRVAVGSAFGAVVTAVALHFKSEAA